MFELKSFGSDVQLTPLISSGAGKPQLLSTVPGLPKTEYGFIWIAELSPWVIILVI
jgi:hypothetical protein